jgi:hypothetical protein
MSYSERAAQVSALIPKWPMEQSFFRVTVRYSYAAGMTIADAIETGLRAVVEHYPEFVPRYERELHALPD